MAFPQAVVTFAIIKIAKFFSTIVFIVIVHHEKVKELYLKQDPFQFSPNKLLYGRFLIFFEILLVSQFLLFLESVLIVWVHFTGMSWLVPVGSNYYFAISIPSINGEWITISGSVFVLDVGSGVATSFLYFYYDKFYCQFQMKGIPALINLGIVIVQNLYIYYLNPFFSSILGIISFIVMGLVCIDLFLAQKSVSHVRIIFLSFVGAFIFDIITSSITSIILDIIFPTGRTIDLWEWIAVLSSFDLVRYVLNYSIITAGILMFLKKSDLADRPILARNGKLTSDQIR